MTPKAPLTPAELNAFTQKIKQWAAELGFADLGITHTNLGTDIQHLRHWLDQNYQAGMQWMNENNELRESPAELVAGTVSIISVRMDYLTDSVPNSIATLNNSEQGYIARYALGRDYHKVMRKRLQKLATKMSEHIGPFGYRAFVDSAPVLEKALARNAGLGWIGKHTLVLNKQAGSFFFVGELFTDLALPIEDEAPTTHCGSCQKCIDVCPTQAIVAPNKLDAGRCIAYLTIEHKGSIPTHLRSSIGNRIFGCDDCQLFCPWNKFANHAPLPDFAVRHELNAPSLQELFNWSYTDWDTKTVGMPIRRTGYDGWLRNIAIALGNTNYSIKTVQQLEEKLNTADVPDMVKEHIRWALVQQESRRPQ